MTDKEKLEWLLHKMDGLVKTYEKSDGFIVAGRRYHFDDEDMLTRVTDYYRPKEKKR